MPGVRSPRRSAPEIIASAMRSLYDPVGLPASSLTHTSAWPGATTRVNGNTGVSPMPDRAEVPGGLMYAIISFRRPDDPHSSLRTREAVGRRRLPTRTDSESGGTMSAIRRSLPAVAMLVAMGTSALVLAHPMTLKGTVAAVERTRIQ